MARAAAGCTAQGHDHRVAVAGLRRRGEVVAGSGAVSNAALPLAEIGGKQQAIAPNDTSVAGVSHRDGNGQNAGDIDHNHDHVEEVIHNDNNHR